jgi:hypothetical protein
MEPPQVRTHAILSRVVAPREPPTLMPCYSYREARPRLGDGVFLAPGARVIGDVELGSGVSELRESFGSGSELVR